MSRKDQVRRLVAWYQAMLSLDSWNIEVKFERIEGGGSECQSAPNYKEVTFIFDLDSIPEEQTELYVRHECLHLCIDSLWQFAERLAEGNPTLTNLLVDVGESVVTGLESARLWRQLAGRPTKGVEVSSS